MKIRSNLSRWKFSPGPLFLSIIWLIFIFSWISSICLAAQVNKLSHQTFLSARRPSIILIVIDSLRPRHLSYFGYSRPTSPIIDQLCCHGVVFRNVIAQSSQTGPAIASLWTGLYPYRHGIELYSYNQSYDPLKREAPPFLDDSFKTIAEYLRENGYLTMALVANPWLQPEYGFAQGFDLYLPLLSNDGQVIIDEFKRVTAGFKMPLDKPFFVYLHLMDTHAPYIHSSKPKNLFVKFKGEPLYGMGYKDVVRSEDISYALGLYDEQIRYVDSLIGQILEYIEQKGFSKETLILLTSDHGEEFYEHLGFGHGITLYEEVINTFLLLHFPSLLGRKEIKDRVQAVDVVPSLLDLLGITYNKEILDGESFLPFIFSSAEVLKRKKEERIALSELGDKKAIIQKNFKFIYNLFLQTEELYDLNRDPGEISNLADKNWSQRKKLRDLLLSVFQQNRKLPSATSSLKESIIEKVRSLGYVSGKVEMSNEEAKILKLPISNQIDFSLPSHNPLQLIYGWKEKRADENGPFYRVGPFVRFVLKPGDNLKKRKSVLTIEGKIEGALSDDFVALLNIYSDRFLLERTQIYIGEKFSIRISLPRKFASDRAAEFILTWGLKNKKSGQDLNLEEHKASFLIYKISWN